MCMCKKWNGKIHIKLTTLRKGISFNCYRLLSFEHYFSDLQGDSSNETYTNNLYICVCLYDPDNLL